MLKLVKEILNLARWAPSGDNTQPWRFEVIDESHVTVHGFDTRKYCLYDLHGFGSQLAHGALLETIGIAASGFGFHAEISRRKNTPDEHLIFDVHFFKDKGLQPSNLFPYIKKRCTQRRPLSTLPLTLNEKNELAASIDKSYHIAWMESWNQRVLMAKLLYASAKIRLTIPEAYKVHNSVIQWNTQTSTDRIPDGAIGLDPLTLRIMRWVMKSWNRVDFMNKYMAGHFLPRIELDLLPALRCAGHFALISNDQPNNIDDNINAGRTMQRFWLTATKLGLLLQPEMTPLIFARYAHYKIPLSQTRNVTQEANNLTVTLDQLLCQQSNKLVFLGRIGHGNLPKARSLRLPLADLLQTDSISDNFMD